MKDGTAVDGALAETGGHMRSRRTARRDPADLPGPRTFLPLGVVAILLIAALIPPAFAQGPAPATILTLKTEVPDTPPQDGLIDGLVVRATVQYDQPGTYTLIFEVRDPITTGTLLSRSDTVPVASASERQESTTFDGPMVYDLGHDGPVNITLFVKLPGTSSPAQKTLQTTIMSRLFYSPDNFPLTFEDDIPTLERTTDRAVFRTNWTEDTILPTGPNGLTVRWSYNATGINAAHPEYLPVWTLTVPEILVWQDRAGGRDNYFQPSEAVYTASLAGVTPTVMDLRPTGRNVTHGEYAQYGLSYNLTFKAQSGGRPAGNLRFNVTFTMAAAGFVVADTGDNKVRTLQGEELKIRYRIELERSTDTGIVIVHDLGMEANPAYPEVLSIPSFVSPQEFALTPGSADTQICGSVPCYYEGDPLGSEPQVAHFKLQPTERNTFTQAFFSWSSHARADGQDTRVRTSYLHTGPSVRFFLGYLFPPGQEVRVIEQDPSVGVFRKGYTDWVPPTVVTETPQPWEFFLGLLIAMAILYITIRPSKRDRPRDRPRKGG